MFQCVTVIITVYMSFLGIHFKSGNFQIGEGKVREVLEFFSRYEREPCCNLYCYIIAGHVIYKHRWLLDVVYFRNLWLVRKGKKQDRWSMVGHWVGRNLRVTNQWKREEGWKLVCPQINTTGGVTSVLQVISKPGCIQPHNHI